MAVSKNAAAFAKPLRLAKREIKPLTREGCKTLLKAAIEDKFYSSPHHSISRPKTFLYIATAEQRCSGEGGV
jgi:hypothetical protein